MHFIGPLKTRMQFYHSIERSWGCELYFGEAVCNMWVAAHEQ